MKRPSNEPIASSHFMALLCINSGELLETATSQLTPLGFEVHTVATGDDAIRNLYSHPYNVIVVSEDFDGGDAQINPVLQELATLPLNFRRRMFVVLVGANLNALSEMQAFALSVELVIRPPDLSNLRLLVGRGLTHHETLYSAFYEVEKRLHAEG